MTDSSFTAQRWLNYFDTRYQHGTFFSNLSIEDFSSLIEKNTYIVVVIGAKETWNKDNNIVPSGDIFAFSLVHQGNKWNLSYSYKTLFHERSINFDIETLSKLNNNNSLSRESFREIFLNGQDPELYPNGIYFHGYFWP